MLSWRAGEMNAGSLQSVPCPLRRSNERHEMQRIG
jgi:hypothetical protein